MTNYYRSEAQQEKKFLSEMLYSWNYTGVMSEQVASVMPKFVNATKPYTFQVILTSKWGHLTESFLLLIEIMLCERITSHQHV